MEKLQKQLQKFLQEHPELIPLQMEIDRNLAQLNSSEARCYYLSIELFDKVDELLKEVNNVKGRLNEFGR